MADEIILQVPLDKPAIHVDAAPGTKVVLRGSYVSKHDGSTIDAATTTWPKEAPGGASVDPIGLIDTEAGGFHLDKRDLDKHEFTLLAQNNGQEACAAAGVAAPCLVVNKRVALQKRLMGWDEFKSSLVGTGIEAVVPTPPPPPVVAPAAVPFLQVAAGVGALLIAGILAVRWKKKRDASPLGQLLALAEGVKKRLAGADAVLAAPLAPAVETALKALRDKRVDPASAEGKRVADALRRVSERLEAAQKEERAAKEQAAADELVAEMEAAIEAAEEVKRAHAP